MLEICAIDSSGLECINKNFENSMSNLCVFLNEESDLKSVLFPACTVLLDLTANEKYVEAVGEYLY